MHMGEPDAGQTDNILSKTRAAQGRDLLGVCV